MRSTKSSGWLKNAAALLLCIGLVSCGGAETPAPRAGTRLLAAAAESVTVTAVAKVAETRVSRTVFDYTFRITVKNNGAASLQGVAATLMAAGTGSTILDGAVVVGDLAAGASMTPFDTITIRHDRVHPFDQGALRWNITSTPTPPAGGGVLLAGDPNLPAEQATIDFVAQAPAELATAQAPGSDAQYYVAQLAAIISPGATVGQVNAALNAVNGKISYMRQRSLALSIHIPGIGSLAALETVSASLRASGAFASALPIYLPQTLALPENVTRAEALDPEGAVFHHVAARVSAAWNAANVDASAAPVELIVIDKFGLGAVSEINGTAEGYSTGQICEREENGVVTRFECYHGYHVLGIIAGSFGGAATPTGKVTGSLPLPLKVHVIDLSLPVIGPAEPYWQAMHRQLTSIFATAPSSRFVINLSSGFCNTIGPDYCVTPASAAVQAVWWRGLVRQIRPTPGGALFDYDNKVVQVSAAGNSGNGASAERASAWNAAVLLGQLQGTPPLANGLVVENRTAMKSPLPAMGGMPVPGPLSARSTTRGNVGAIGTHVYSFVSPTMANFLDGTSMASPQVAGVAAYMLAIRPAMSPPDLIAALKGTGQAPSAGAAPVLDAFAALLSLDKDITNAPVRIAMLQPGVSPPAASFSFANAMLFLQAFFPEAYPLLPRENPDMSRFDLNGDGFTGGASHKAAFNLDMAPGYVVSGAVDHYPNGGAITIDKTQVTDFQVLCYYVNSPLFDDAGRTLFETELARIAGAVGRPVSCAYPPSVELNVETTNPGWIGLPAHIRLSRFALTTREQFNRTGDPLSTCGGERGFPPYSNAVDPAAAFYSVELVQAMPINIGGPGINRRPCSSFYAALPSGPGLADQVWINATGRGQQFGGTVVLDWEIQIRYTNGHQRGPVATRQCEVGVVANAGFFSKSFDAVCTHTYFDTNSIAE